MELGEGDNVAVAVWVAAFAAVAPDLTLGVVSADDADPGDEYSLTRRCHKTLTDAVTSGGWRATTTIETGAVDALEQVETVLVREVSGWPERREAVVARVWDVVTDVEAASRSILVAVERERARRGSDWTVSALVVVTSTKNNRRRVSEARAVLTGLFPGLAAAWYAALRSPQRRLPAAHGILWTDDRGTRLRPSPMLPGWIWTEPAAGPMWARGS